METEFKLSETTKNSERPSLWPEIRNVIFLNAHGEQYYEIWNSRSKCDISPCQISSFRSSCCSTCWISSRTDTLVQKKKEFDNALSGFPVGHLPWYSRILPLLSSGCDKVSSWGKTNTYFKKKFTSIGSKSWHPHVSTVDFHQHKANCP